MQTQIKHTLVLACLLMAVGLNTTLAATIHVPGDQPTIQAAVNAAANGDTIHIAAGTYTEQVVITDKSLTLIGDPGATLKATAGMAQTLAPFTSRRPVLGLLRSNVDISGLSFDGDGLGGVNPRFVGVYYFASSGTASECEFKGFRAAAAQVLAVGLIAANLTVAGGAAVTHVEALNNELADNETGIVMVGDDFFDPAVLHQTFVIEGNTITGLGSGVPIFQVGMLIGVGASGTVEDNVVTGHLGVGAFGPSIGILAYDALVSLGLRPTPVALQPIKIVHNVVENNLQGILALVADQGRLVNNQINNHPGPAIIVTGQDVGVINNRISNAGVGILLHSAPTIGTATDCKVIANRISGVPAVAAIVELPGVTGTKLQANKIEP